MTNCTMTAEAEALLDKCMKSLQDLLESRQELSSGSISKIEEDVEVVFNIVEEIQKGKKLEPNYAPQLCQNMLCSLGRIKALLESGRMEEALLFLKCESVSILKMLSREIEYFYCKVTDEKALQEYFKEEETLLKKLCNTEKKDPEGEFPYEVSIIVLFYNNKEITRQCIESILKYTTDINYELITVNNGSDEETGIWADSLPHSKKINLKYNIGASRGATLAVLQNVVDGKYAVYLSNDIIVTKNWLKSLLACIKSDPKIAYASPVCNSASNRQAIPVSYTDLSQMHQFAEAYNKTNPLLWEERARLFCMAMIFRPWVFEEIGGHLGLYFSYDMFADDDLCVKINRAGYRMVLCKDTFVHHFGSATLKDGQFEVMEKGRSQFYHKYGFDSWGALGEKFIYYESMLNFIKCGPVKILAVNPQYGEEFLMLKNALKRSNITDVTVDVFNMDERFQQGLITVADRAFYGCSMTELEKFTGGNKYDIIMLCQEAASCNELETFMRASVRLLKENSRLFILLDNIYSRNVICNILTKRNLSDDFGQKDMGRKAFISLNALAAFAETLELQVTNIINVSSYYQKNEVIEQGLAKLIQLDQRENDVCYNTVYYNIGLGLKQIN